MCARAHAGGAVLLLAKRVLWLLCPVSDHYFLAKYLLIASEGGALCCEKSMLGYKTMGSLLAERNWCVVLVAIACEMQERKKEGRYTGT
jgi:hypothetical protein